MPGMLHGAVRFTDHPRARVLRIDTGAGPRADPGVVAVLTAADVPGERRQGEIIRRLDRSSSPWARPPGTSGTCIAVVAASTRDAARAGGRRWSTSTYDVLPPVTST